MPNGILGHNNRNSKQQTHKSRQDEKVSSKSSTGHRSKTQPPTSSSNQLDEATQPKAGANILNVAEMLLHGVADNEILDIWLRSISCQEFVANFIDAGYDMPTISRITPQDLTAIGITDPAKRLKILSEIKKLNLQDGIPQFKPINLNHWLSLIRLDSFYYKSLCDQQVDSIEKMCQLTWEDFEELGISKLGHQKRLQLAIERIKELDENEKKASKPMSEPIYDTNPSQILLVASSENHSMNGPIINKQSSTSELSSTGSGSMHSVYSANSSHYQPTYASVQQLEQQRQQQQLIARQQTHQQQQQPIYSQPPSQVLTQQHSPQVNQHLVQQTTNSILADNGSHRQQLQSQQVTTSLNQAKFNSMTTPQNRQSLGQLPFSALANLPKHQQQLLQQSSIYATLSRQPQRAKQPPPPVPIRTNSLKSNSLFDETGNDNNNRQQFSNHHATSTSSLFRSGTRVSTRNNMQFNSQTMLSKNKSFCGNAHMDALRARYLNRNSQNQFLNQAQHTQSIVDQSNSANSGNSSGRNDIIYGVHPNHSSIYDGYIINGHSLKRDSDNLSLYSRQSLGSTIQTNHFENGITGLQPSSMKQHLPFTNSQMTNGCEERTEAPKMSGQRDDYDLYSDTNSIKSSIIPSSGAMNPPMDQNSLHNDNSSSRDSGSSQTLYNSASSGSSNEQNLNNLGNSSLPNNRISHHSTASSSTLNDIHTTMDQLHNSKQSALPLSQAHSKSLASASSFAPEVSPSANKNANLNATTGKDDEFPPPPSPLSFTDFDEQAPASLTNEAESNFNKISNGLMTFRVGT